MFTASKMSSSFKATDEDTSRAVENAATADHIRLSYKHKTGIAFQHYLSVGAVAEDDASRDSEAMYRRAEHRRRLAVG